MASIAGLCWTAAEDLFRDLDLDELYMRQIAALDLRDNRDYPYAVVIFTGKITLRISLGTTLARDQRTGALSGHSRRSLDGKKLLSGRPAKESSE
ncbi:MAG: hypothetical protein HY914_07480 [Desulfomonile tiedjei]|nr:hypothetical protein [Desulfomonile tiedjei]